MLTDHVRDFAGTAAVFGFFASAWFGWAQESPPRRWKPFLVTGSVLSVLTAAAGGLLLWRLWNDATAFDDTTGPRFGIVVGIEFGVAALAGVPLARRRALAVSATTGLPTGAVLLAGALVSLAFAVVEAV